MIIMPNRLADPRLDEQITDLPELAMREKQIRLEIRRRRLNVSTIRRERCRS